MNNQSLQPEQRRRIAQAINLCAFAGLLVCMACSAVQPVRVLPVGQTQLTASLGGPILPNSSPTIIVPYLTLGAMHGVSESVTLTGQFHALMAVFGTLGVDAGAAARLLKQDGAVPELTAHGKVYLFSNFRPGATRLYPYLSLNASYQLGEMLLAYAAVENVVSFTGSPYYFLNPSVGGQVRLSERVNLQVEAKYLAANVNTLNGIFEAQSTIGSTGSIGAMLGFTCALGDVPPVQTK